MQPPSPDSIRARYANGGHEDGRLFAPSVERNTVPIVHALSAPLAGRTGLILEIGSGTGQHTIALADAYPRLTWQPSDPFGVHLDSIRAWVAHADTRNVQDAIWLDAAEDWPELGNLTGVFSANVVHIAPWIVTEGIFRGAERAHAALVMFYGPFREGGVHTGDGNQQFDAMLRAEDPQWGIRDIDDISDLATRSGYGSPDVTVMPSNNRLIVYERG